MVTKKVLIMTKSNILDFLKSHKEELESKFFVTKIGLFGSYAKDTANEDSDIDIVIQSTKKDFFLREDLREYLESNLNKSVDVGYLDSIRAYYKNKIEKDIIYV
jgi:predicted nucleotidyltransferase